MMQIRDALAQQSPSLALQRAAADEIARLDMELYCCKDIIGAVNAEHALEKMKLQQEIIRLNDEIRSLKQDIIAAYKEIAYLGGTL